jgi:hypothetical protein
MNTLTFEAEPFELSPQASSKKSCDCPKCRAARESSEGETFEDEISLEQRVPPGGGFFQREFAEEIEAADFELPEASEWEAVPPGGGRFDRESEAMEFEGPLPRRVARPERCVPRRPILTNAAAIARARAFNTRAATSLLWGNLVDQIEVNIFRCPRTAGRLTPENFAQATALFQRQQALAVDGMLGPNTWRRMKTIRAERDPFPRAPLNTPFDATPNAALCELHTHPAIDIGLVGGTPLPAIADGLCIYAGDVGTLQTCPVATGCATGAAVVAACGTLSYGRAVIIEHPSRGPGRQPGGASVYSIYAHVQFTRGRRVATGENVLAGRIVAEVGADCVGFSTGPHLHYVVVSGRRQFRLRAGPSRPQICGTFWPAMTPQRPRSTATAAAFQW